MWFRQVLRLQSISRQNFRVQVKYEIHLCPVLSAVKPARSRKNGYYEVLGISANSRAGDIKTGYLNVVKKHHPDRAGQDNDESKAIFEEATEAYQCLMDPTQRYFYDRHGFPPEIKNHRSSSTYDYSPKYQVYRENKRPDEQSQKEYEEWIRSQGHSGQDEKSYKQRLKNMYVEFRYGFKYYDLPWKLKEFFQMLLGVSITIGVISYGFISYVRYMMQSYDKGNNPPRLNDMSKNPEIALQNDILGVSGARNYANSPFYWTANPNAKPYETESTENPPKRKRTAFESRSKTEKNGNETETRKQKRTRIRKELEDYKISHRMGVLKYRLQIIDSESEIVRNEIRTLEKSLSGE